MFSPPERRSRPAADVAAQDNEKLALAEAFLAAMLPVEQNLTGLSQNVDNIVAVCSSVMSVVGQSQRDISDLARQAEAIQRDREAVKKKLEQATAIAAELEISAADWNALSNGPTEGESFLAALDRAAAVRQRTTELLSAHSLDDVHALAMDALEVAVKAEREGMSVLFTYLSDVLGAARDSNALEAAARDTVVCKGLARLAQLRPAHYAACQDTVCRVRQAAVTDRFLAEAVYGSRASMGSANANGGGAYNSGNMGSNASVSAYTYDDDAATSYTAPGQGQGQGRGGGGGGGAGGGDAAMRSGGEDQVRAVADLLAWLHLCLAEESESLRSLFAPLESSQGAQAAQAEAEGEGDPDRPRPLSVRTMVEKIAHPLCRPLARGLQRAIGSHSSLLVLVRVKEVLRFYATKLRSLLDDGSSSAVVAAIEEAEAQASSAFEQQLQLSAARLRSAPPSFPSSLAMTSTMADTGVTLRELLTALEPVSGASAAAVPPAATDANAHVWRISHVLDSLMPPAIEHTSASADGLPSLQLGIFMVNNLYGLQAMLAASPGAAEWMNRLASEAGAHETALSEQVSGKVLVDTGVLRTINTLSSSSSASASASVAASVKAVAGAFCSTVLAPQLMAVFDAVTNARVRARLRRETGGILAAAYAKLYTLVADGSSVPAPALAEAGGIAAVFRYSPAQIEEALELK
jgi:hypothetical protein